MIGIFPTDKESVPANAPGTNLTRFRTVFPQSLRALFGGSERTAKAKKNILTLFLLKGVNVIAGFLLVPLTLDYLSPVKYGIWLTLASIIGWINYFDIGLGNGLRNKFAEARAKGDAGLTQTYVSSAYFVLGAFVGLCLLTFYAISGFVNWSVVLNAPQGLRGELALLALVAVTFSALRFVFGLIGMILTADQEPAQSSAIDVSASVLSLIAVYVVTKTTHGSLLYVGAALTGITALVPFLVSLYLFQHKYRPFAPSYKSVNREHAKELMNLGGRFFILQIGSLVVFASSNIVITQLFDPSAVVPYTVAFRYFNLASMVYAILLIPFWSAYTDAFLKHDYAWIHRTFRKLKQLWFILAAGVTAMVFVSDRFYLIWVGPTVTVPFSVSVSMAAYVLINSWCNIYVNFINGTGKIRLETWGAVIVGLMNVPLAILLAKAFHLGIAGIVLAPSLCLLPWCFVWPIQTRRILAGRATGIWAG